MENEIKKLIEKYSKEYNEVPPFSAIPTWIVIKNLQSLLEFKQKNCCGKETSKEAELSAYNKGYDDGYDQAQFDLRGRE